MRSRRWTERTGASDERGCRSVINIRVFFSTSELSSARKVQIRKILNIRRRIAAHMPTLSRVHASLSTHSNDTRFTRFVMSAIAFSASTARAAFASKGYVRSRERRHESSRPSFDDR